jgi:hydroxyacylglutathione hydrolase
MDIHTVVVGAFEVNCYIVDLGDGDALVIDPGADPDAISEVLKDKGLTPSAYLLTHGHMDHISGLEALHSTHPAPIALHAADAKWAFGPLNEMPPYYPIPAKPEKIDIDLGACTAIPNIGASCTVITTPGHTPGSVCLHFPDSGVLFTGDTLFAGSVGRTDLPGGDSKELAESLKKLRFLSDETKVLAGHGPASNIGHEKKTNYFMQVN